MTQPWEIENFLDVRNNQLHIDGVSTVELARDYGTPLFVFSEARIRHNIARLQRVETVIGCPLKICYAAKANSTMAILRAVKDAGIDIEVNSGGELWKVLRAGFTGDQIIFNGTSKEVWEIENAINAEIYAIQVDSLYELSLIEETAKRLGKRANVSLRLVPEIESGTHSGLQTALLTSKFGMMPDEAFSAFRDYEDSPHLNLAGIHLHVGSQNPDPLVYTAALETLYKGLKRIYTETSRTLEHVNIGGGFPVNYLRDHSLEDEFLNEQREMFDADFDPADAINAAWHATREHIGSADDAHLFDNVTLLLEPGRSVIADAGICLTTVRNLKKRPLSRDAKMRVALQKKMLLRRNELRQQLASKGSGIGAERIDVSDELSRMPFDEDTWLLTDAGFNNLLSMETYKWYYHLVSVGRAGEPHDFPYKLAGPLCDGGDVYFDHEGKNRLPEHRPLPADIKPGDVLALLNTGAYAIAQESQYNGRFLPAVVLIREDGNAELIRKREGFEDLIANDIF
jgi:diaminopimelate decarboxylase